LTDPAVNVVTAVAGVLSNAAEFTSNTERLEHADDATLSTGSIDFTLQAWVSLSSKPGSKMNIVSKNTVGAGEFFLQWDNSADKFIFLTCSSGFTCTTATFSATTPSTSTFYHILAGHRNGSNVWIRVNCGTEVTASHAGGGQDTTGKFYIGDDEFTEGWLGAIDEVAFWKADKSADCSSLYNGGAGLAYPLTVVGGSPRQLLLMGVGQ
jgi:hypothetical protein